MANPAVRHRHRVEQVLDLVPDLPQHVRRSVEGLLRERDEGLEDGINEGLRYTRSANALGSGGTITSIYPVLTGIGNTIALICEKQHDRSRFEIDLTLRGEYVTGAGILVGAVRIAAVDGTAFTTTDVVLGQANCPLGHTTVTWHDSTDGVYIPHGRYLVTAMAAVDGAARGWKQDAASTNSMRVSESLY